ncbi:hypothetical protein Vi05172_g4266 [Venturia inaequalis]|nr:hypothetical protein Vi05172_g4266 [Venturia inaequalis]
MVYITSLLPLLSLTLPLTHATPATIKAPDTIALEKQYARLGDQDTTLTLFSGLKFRIAAPFIHNFKAKGNECHNVDDDMHIIIRSLQMEGGRSCEFYPETGCRVKAGVWLVHLEGAVDVGDSVARMGWGPDEAIRSLRCRKHWKK